MITLGHVFNRQNSLLSSTAVYIPKLISENYLHVVLVLGRSLRKPLHLINRGHCIPEKWFVQRFLDKKPHLLSLKIHESSSHPHVSVGSIQPSQCINRHKKHWCSGSTPASWGGSEGLWYAQLLTGTKGSKMNDAQFLPSWGSQTCKGNMELDSRQIQSGTKTIPEECTRNCGSSEEGPKPALRMVGRNLSWKGWKESQQHQVEKGDNWHPPCREHCMSKGGRQPRWAGSGQATPGKPEEPNPERSQTTQRQTSVTLSKAAVSIRSKQTCAGAGESWVGAGTR